MFSKVITWTFRTYHVCCPHFTSSPNTPNQYAEEKVMDEQIEAIIYSEITD